MKSKFKIMSCSIICLIMLPFLSLICFADDPGGNLTADGHRLSVSSPQTKDPNVKIEEASTDGLSGESFQSAYVTKTTTTNPNTGVGDVKVTAAYVDNDGNTVDATEYLPEDAKTQDVKNLLEFYILPILTGSAVVGGLVTGGSGNSIAPNGEID